MLNRKSDVILHTFYVKLEASTFFSTFYFRSDAVRVGDRILAINEITLRGKPLWRAFELLRTAGDIVKLLIKRDLCSVSCRQSVGKSIFLYKPFSRFHWENRETSLALRIN